MGRLLRVVDWVDSLLTGAENDRHVVKMMLSAASLHNWGV